MKRIKKKSIKSLLSILLMFAMMLTLISTLPTYAAGGNDSSLKDIRYNMDDRGGKFKFAPESISDFDPQRLDYYIDKGNNSRVKLILDKQKPGQNVSVKVDGINVGGLDTGNSFEVDAQSIEKDVTIFKISVESEYIKGGSLPTSQTYAVTFINPKMAFRNSNLNSIKYHIDDEGGKFKYAPKVISEFNPEIKEYTIDKGNNTRVMFFMDKQFPLQRAWVTKNGSHIVLEDKYDCFEFGPESIEDEETIFKITVESEDESNRSEYLIKVSNAKVGTQLTGKVTIAGKEEFGEYLTATVTDTNNTGTLSYLWTRNIGAGDITTGNKYYIDKRFDGGNIITCEVTSSVQTGSISASTGTLPKTSILVAPTGLVAAKASAPGKMDGKIIGTEDYMEYANNINFVGAKDCSPKETTGLKAATYYVRVKASKSSDASPYATIIVGETSGTNLKVTVDVNKDDMDKAIKYAGKDEDGNPLISIRTDESTTEKGSSFNISPEAMDSLLNTGDGALSINVGDVNSTFDNKAIAEIKKQAGNGITTFFIGLADKTLLNLNQKATIGNNKAYELSVNAGVIEISKFKGNATVSLPYSPKTGESLEAIVVYYVDEKGEVEIVKNGTYNAKSGLITFTTKHFSLYMIKNNQVKFSDIKNDHWAKPAIDFASARELVRGIGHNQYNPSGTLTRAELIQMIQNVLNLPIADKSIASYGDVESNSWFNGPIMSAKSAGLLKGIKLNGNKFMPNQAITREEMAVILANTAIYKKAFIAEEKIDLKKFKDYKEINKEFEDEILIAMNLGLLSKEGKGGGIFGPKDTTTRAEAAQVQINLFKVLKLVD